MLTKLEIAKEFKVTLPTIDRWMAKGMPYIKSPTTGAVRFILEDAKKWFTEGSK